jgi:hypothetical protein
MPLEPCDVDGLARAQCHVDDVTARLAIGILNVVNTSDVVAPRDDAFGEQKSGGELEVVPRRPHRDADGCTIQANLQRLLDRHVVVDLSMLARIPLDDRRGFHALRRVAHREP